MAIRVFAVNDMEWWAADMTPEELLAHYMEVTGVTHEEATGDEDDLPTELTAEDMERYKFGVDDDGNKLETPITFREMLDRMIEEGTEFPCLFAATE